WLGLMKHCFTRTIVLLAAASLLGACEFSKTSTAPDNSAPKAVRSTALAASAASVIDPACAPPSLPDPAHGVTVTDMTSPAVTANVLATTLASSEVAISNVVYKGAARAAGTFASDLLTVGINSGVIL